MDGLDIFVELIKRFEGLRLNAYLCPAGVWTCGYGTTGPDVRSGVKWSQQYSEDRMIADAKMFMAGALTLVPTADTPGRKAAMADFAYNLGLTRLKGSTLRKKALVRDWAGVEVELLKWTRGGGKILPGLVLRRQAEVKLLK